MCLLQVNYRPVESNRHSQLILEVSAGSQLLVAGCWGHIEIPSPGGCASVKHHSVHLALVGDEEDPVPLAAGSVTHANHTGELLEIPLK